MILNNENGLSAEIQPVIAFAVQAHQGQVRKGSGLPYIVHPMAVLSQLASWDIRCSKTWKAAITHDILEERPDITFEELCEIVGPEAAAIVQELTFFPKDPSTATAEKALYMRSFKDKSVEALVIKVADRICNTRDFLDTTPGYARKYWNKADDLFDTMITRGEEIAETFGIGPVARMKYSKQLLDPVLAQ